MTDVATVIRRTCSASMTLRHETRSTMFAISADAQAIVRQIAYQPGLPETAGLRIASAEDRRHLQVRTASAPRRGDHVVNFDGARIFLDAVATARLDDQILHVRTKADGRLEFRSRPRRVLP